MACSQPEEEPPASDLDIAGGRGQVCCSSDAVAATCCVAYEVEIKETRDVAQWLVRRNSNPKTLGSIPWRCRVRSSFSVPPSQLLLCGLVCA